jgi:hypothetical protein
MKIHFQRSGGLAGVVMEAVLDTASLPAEKAGELEKLVQSANVFSAPENLVGPQGSADDFQYRIAIEDGARRHSIVLDGQATPAEMKPLVRWLTAAALPKKKS